MASIGPHTPALTLILSQFQGQVITLVPHSSSTPLLIVMAFRVHRMKIIACSHVWCAQSDQEHLQKVTARTRVLEQILA